MSLTPAQPHTTGFGIGVIGEFLFLFLQELGGSEALMGLTLTFTCLAEVPMFQLQGELLQRISVAAALHLVLATYVLRLGLYACLPHLPGCPWVVLPIELLHGITFGLGWGAGTVNSRRVAPPALAATMQVRAAARHTRARRCLPAAVASQQANPAHCTADLHHALLCCWCRCMRRASFKACTLASAKAWVRWRAAC